MKMLFHNFTKPQLEYNLYSQPKLRTSLFALQLTINALAINLFLTLMSVAGVMPAVLANGVQIFLCIIAMGVAIIVLTYGGILDDK